MKYCENLVIDVEQAGHEIFWQGPAGGDQIGHLEEVLKFRLPCSFKNFLKSYGGGGVGDAEISGIEDNRALLAHGGTVFGDTLRVRDDYELPDKLAVIFFRDGEVCWCIDGREQNEDQELPIVSYSLIFREIEGVIFNSFDEFFRDYLTLRSQPFD